MVRYCNNRWETNAHKLVKEDFVIELTDEETTEDLNIESRDVELPRCDRDHYRRHFNLNQSYTNPLEEGFYINIAKPYLI